MILPPLVFPAEAVPSKAEVFVHGKPLQTNQLFASKAGALPEYSIFQVLTLALPANTNIRVKNLVRDKRSIWL